MKKKLVNIPVPSQLPCAPDLEQFPEDVVKSKAVEYLIHQNDDLMARLSVSLRRISLFEDMVNKYNQKTEKIRFHYDNLKDQVLILKEKNKSFSQRQEREAKDVQKISNENKLLNIRLNELKVARDEKENQLLAHVSHLKQDLNRFAKYRLKIQKVSAKLKGQLNVLKSENIRIEKKYQNLMLSQKDLNKKVEEAALYVKSTTDEHKEQIQQLTEKYEQEKQDSENVFLEQKKDFDQQITQLKDQLKSKEKLDSELRDRQNQLDKTDKEKSRLQNQIIYLERKSDDKVKSLETELNKSKEDLAHYRKEAFLKSSQVDGLSQQISDLSEDKKLLEDKSYKVEQQVESLQIMWSDSQGKFEKFESKNQALQKINQQLSLQLNQTRKELNNLKENLPQLKRSNLQHNRGVPEPSSIKNVKAQPATKSEFELNSKNNMDQIDNLIAEIQSGFTTSR